MKPAAIGLDLPRPVPFELERPFEQPQAPPHPVVEEHQASPSLFPQQDSLELNGTSLATLRVSLQMHLEQNIMDQTGGVVGQRTFDISMIYERLRINHSDAPAQNESPRQVDPFIQKLMEYFNPERTADRILNFISKGFKHTSFGSEDTADSRKAFSEFITPFIRSGVDQALSAFGDLLPDEMKSQAEETFRLIEEGLKNFAAGETQG